MQRLRKMLWRIESKYKSKEYSAKYFPIHKKRINKLLEKLKDDLKTSIDNYNSLEISRNVQERAKNTHNIVSVFDSALTRAFEMTDEALNLSMVIVRVYYFGIAESLIKHGFFMNGHRYVFFSASAGQIRTKKLVMLQESVLNNVMDKLTCGLSVDKINEQGGININKYLAYLALCNSATDVWEDFDIDSCIVVDDLETNVRGIVDHIDPNTYEIERKEMDVPIKHTDGCGMMLTSVSQKSFMVRMPWIKGLLTPFRFDDFISKANALDPAHPKWKVVDIWGKTYDIKKDKIKIILTKSMFKTAKYYSSWDEYKTLFKQYGCTAGKCNEEEDYIRNATINYQMLQTLTDITDAELTKLTETTRRRVTEIAQSKESMLSAFGASNGNENMNSFQQALLMYPELLRDKYTKDTLSQIKKSMENDAWAGKLHIRSKYTFIIPDMYAFCEYLFLGDKNPKGLLANGEVYCRLYRNVKELDCLRSPHLFLEHAPRQNVCQQGSPLTHWYITDGLYTSCHDKISKILQFDE